jgi:tetratricopeptide (TPR) repeat protein
MKRAEVRGQRTEVRGQGSGFRQVGVLAVVLLAGCAAPKAQFTDADWVSHSTTGRAAYERGDFRRAADAYGRAQQRARALDDADALAVAAANRAVALMAVGRAAEAREAIGEALADGRISPRRRAELLAGGARASVALGQPDDALVQAAGALKENPGDSTRAQALLAQSAAHLARGEPGRAADALASGLSAKAWVRLPAALRAERSQRLAQIAVAEGRSADAAAGFDEASTLWSEAGRLPEMARALAEAGRQARQAGDGPGAGERLYRAARSLWSQGHVGEAVPALEEGVACAAEAGDEALGRRMAELLVTFQKESRQVE